MHLKPSQIFFTQNSIDNRFGMWCIHRKTYIGETLDDICNGRCSIGNIPPMIVVKKDNKWFTLNNRRLWVFRHLERLGKCTEIEVEEGTEIPSSKLTTDNGGSDIEVRGDPDGIWHTKPSVIQLNITAEAEPETDSASSSTDGDIEEQKYIASDGQIESKAYTDNNDKKDIIYIQNNDFDDMNVTEPSKSAKEKVHDKMPIDSSMPAHISRQTSSVDVVGTSHQTRTTYFGDSHSTKRKRSVSPQVDHLERNESGETGTGGVQLSQQDDYPKRVCLYTIPTSVAPRTPEEALPTVPVFREECDVKTLQRNNLLPKHPLSIVSSGISDGQGMSESNVADTLSSIRQSDSSETDASQTTLRTPLRRRQEEIGVFPRRSRRLKHLPPLPNWSL